METIRHIDTTFEHEYELEWLRETPAKQIPHYYYPGATTKGGHDGILIKVSPSRGNNWLGTFAFGTLSPRGISGVFTSPNADRLCVLAKGQGYLVSSKDPCTWEEVLAAPIIDVRPIRAQKIIVFASFTQLIAHGEQGVRWRTKRLTWDDLKITEVTDTVIRGEYWDMGSESIRSFLVDLVSGSIEGGIDWS